MAAYRSATFSGRCASGMAAKSAVTLTPAIMPATGWLSFRSGRGPVAAPGLQAADDLPDGHDEEQLAEHRLGHRERLPGIGRRDQVPVPHGRHRDEAEEQVLAERAMPGRAEERDAAELARRL